MDQHIANAGIPYSSPIRDVIRQAVKKLKAISRVERIFLVGTQHNLFKLLRYRQNRDHPAHRVKVSQRITPDSVLDVLQHQKPNGDTEYYIIDAWVIGSRRLYDEPFEVRSKCCK